VAEGEEIDGSDLSYNPGNQGDDIIAFYSGLPDKNSEFGKKRVKARLNVDGCQVEADV